MQNVQNVVMQNLYRYYLDTWYCHTGVFDLIWAYEYYVKNVINYHDEGEI